MQKDIVSAKNISRALERIGVWSLMLLTSKRLQRQNPMWVGTLLQQESVTIVTVMHAQIC